MGESFDEIVAGQFDTTDPVFNAELRDAARRIHNSWGPAREKIESKFFATAKAHGLSPEEAKKLFVELTSNPPSSESEEV